ncbi:LysE family transporter [Chlorobium sp.]|uniref:LysE family transporter n=1 Tax=Chlorobium sp. TaxID=1095 RepID=UPI00342A6413
MREEISDGFLRYSALREFRFGDRAFPAHARTGHCGDSRYRWAARQTGGIGRSRRDACGRLRFYMLAAVTGLAALMQSGSALLQTLQWLGAGYLCWTGLQQFLVAGRGFAGEQVNVGVLYAFSRSFCFPVFRLSRSWP